MKINTYQRIKASKRVTRRKLLRGTVFAGVAALISTLPGNRPKPILEPNLVLPDLSQAERHLLNRLLAQAPYVIASSGEVTIAGQTFQTWRDMPRLNHFFNSQMQNLNRSIIFRKITDRQGRRLVIVHEVRNVTVVNAKHARPPEKLVIGGQTLTRLKTSAQNAELISIAVDDSPRTSLAYSEFNITIHNRGEERAQTGLHFGETSTQGFQGTDLAFARAYNRAARTYRGFYGERTATNVTRAQRDYRDATDVHEEFHRLQPYFFEPLYLAISPLKHTTPEEKARGRDYIAWTQAPIHAFECLADIYLIERIAADSRMPDAKKQAIAASMVKSSIGMNWEKDRKPEGKNLIFPTDYWLVGTVLLCCQEKGPNNEMRFNLKKAVNEYFPKMVKVLLAFIEEETFDARIEIARHLGKVTKTTNQNIGNLATWLSELTTLVGQLQGQVRRFEQRNRRTISNSLCEQLAWDTLLDSTLFSPVKDRIAQSLRLEKMAALQIRLAHSLGLFSAEEMKKPITHENMRQKLLPFLR